MPLNRPTALAALVTTAVAAGAVIAAPAAMAAASTPAPTTPAAPPVHTPRIGGADRYATAIDASKSAFAQDGSASAVVLARGDVYADALAGMPLAAKDKASTLLTESAKLTPGVADEIKRVLGADKTKTITLLGGTGAVSADTEAQVKALGYQVVRIGGLDRYYTSLLIANKLGAKNAVVATGTDFADALAAGPLAASQADTAVVLSDGKTLPADVKTYVTGKKVTAVGQPAVDAAKAAGVTATPLAGIDRYATAGAVAVAMQPSTVVLATGADFADPLVGGVYAAEKGGALLLTDGKALSPATALALEGIKSPLKSFTVFGGTNAIAQSVEDAAAAIVNGGQAAKIQALKDAVAKAQTAVTSAQTADDAASKVVADATTAYPANLGGALVARDAAVTAKANTDATVKTGYDALVKAEAQSTDTAVAKAYTDYKNAAATPATAATARFALQTAVDNSTDKAVVAASTQFETSANASTDVAVKAGQDKVAVATQVFEKAGADLRTADAALATAKSDLAAAQKALADAQQ